MRTYIMNISGQSLLLRLDTGYKNLRPLECMPYLPDDSYLKTYLRDKLVSLISIDEKQPDPPKPPDPPTPWVEPPFVQTVITTLISKDSTGVYAKTDSPVSLVSPTEELLQCIVATREDPDEGATLFYGANTLSKNSVLTCGIDTPTDNKALFAGAYLVNGSRTLYSMTTERVLNLQYSPTNKISAMAWLDDSCERDLKEPIRYLAPAIAKKLYYLCIRPKGGGQPITPHFIEQPSARGDAVLFDTPEKIKGFFDNATVVVARDIERDTTADAALVFYRIAKNTAPSVALNTITAVKTNAVIAIDGVYETSNYYYFEAADNVRYPALYSFRDPDWSPTATGPVYGCTTPIIYEPNDPEVTLISNTVGNQIKQLVFSTRTNTPTATTVAAKAYTADYKNTIDVLMDKQVSPTNQHYLYDQQSSCVVRDTVGGSQGTYTTAEPRVVQLDARRDPPRAWFGEGGYDSNAALHRICKLSPAVVRKLFYAETEDADMVTSRPFHSNVAVGGKRPQYDSVELTKYEVDDLLASPQSEEMVVRDAPAVWIPNGVGTLMQTFYRVKAVDLDPNKLVLITALEITGDPGNVIGIDSVIKHGDYVYLWPADQCAALGDPLPPAP